MWHRALNRNVCLCDIAPAPPSTILGNFKNWNHPNIIINQQCIIGHGGTTPATIRLLYRWHKYRTHWWWHTPASCVSTEPWATTDATQFSKASRMLFADRINISLPCVFLKWSKHENQFLSEGSRQHDACDRSFFNSHVILTFSGCQEPWSLAFPRTWDYINRPRKNFPNWAPLAKKLARRVVAFNSLFVLRVPSFHGNLYWLRRQSMCSIGARRCIPS